MRLYGAMLGLAEAKMSDDSFLGPVGIAAGAAFHGPGQRLAEGLSEDRSTGFADGRQLLERPLIRMALPQLSHQKAVRQHDEVHMPGLALAVAQLTVSHAQLLLAIPMKGLRAYPTMPVRPHDAAGLPAHPVGHQDDPGRRVVLL